MKTRHLLHFGDSRKMRFLGNRSVDLVVTSPPYPMIAMWDEVFIKMAPSVAHSLEAGSGWEAFEQMHRQLDPVWKEVSRVLKPGGIACINIGDAVRKLGGDFFLYPNHFRIIQAFLKNSMSPLPAVLWRKQTNAPNKFMGSGMLPAGAYVTLEHEYVLIFRKGGKREFDTPEERLLRQQSAYFWEERNQWFSDVWFDLKGARQNLVDKNLRKRSGAFPFLLPWRLIHMYSVHGDTVLDPFAGTGTTMFAAMASARNSIGVELEASFYPAVAEKAGEIPEFAREIIDLRLQAHLEFAARRKAGNKPLKHANAHHGFPVMTRQEARLQLLYPVKVENPETGCFIVDCRPSPQAFAAGHDFSAPADPPEPASAPAHPVQQTHV